MGYSKDVKKLSQDMFYSKLKENFQSIVKFNETNLLNKDMSFENVKIQNSNKSFNYDELRNKQRLGYVNEMLHNYGFNVCVKQVGKHSKDNSFYVLSYYNKIDEIVKRKCLNRIQSIRDIFGHYLEDVEIEDKETSNKLNYYERMYSIVTNENVFGHIKIFTYTMKKKHDMKAVKSKFVNRGWFSNFCDEDDVDFTYMDKDAIYEIDFNMICPSIYD